MSISKRFFGIAATGETVTCWRIKHPSGAAVEVLNFGATTHSVKIPDKLGKLRNVCMGYGSISEYEKSDAFSGAIVGRHAGRIAGGEFELDGRQFRLATNNGPNHLHGGAVGFSHKIWSVVPKNEKLLLTYISPDCEEGYPGTLSITVAYEWSGPRTLKVTIDALCDRNTIASFTHHGYWNLSDEVTVSNHFLQINADTFTAVDKHVLATGELVNVKNTPFDFRSPRILGDVWDINHPLLIPEYGLDHTFPTPGQGMRELGSLASTDLKLTVSSTLPALHVYTGKRTHVALEAQFIPDAIHHPNFPSTVLKAGTHWTHAIEYKFDDLNH